MSIFPAIACAFLLTACFGYIICIIGVGIVDAYKGWRKMEGKTQRCIVFWTTVFCSVWYVVYSVITEQPWIMEIWNEVSTM